VLAHTTSNDETLSLIMLFAGLWTGWAALSRIRERGFPRMPVGVAWAGVTLAVVLVVLSLVVPRRIFPGTAASATPVASGPRPASTASIAFSRPTSGQTVSGPDLEVVLTLTGGTIVDAVSTRLTPDTGHVHLSLDGRLASMTYGLVQSIPIGSLSDGEHHLTAEFVAADHGPFDPRVTATVTFVKAAGP
jgi:hypothetical protein